MYMRANPCPTALGSIVRLPPYPKSYAATLPYGVNPYERGPAYSNFRLFFGQARQALPQGRCLQAALVYPRAGRNTERGARLRGPFFYGRPGLALRERERESE